MEQPDLTRERRFWVGGILVDPRMNTLTFQGESIHLEHQVMQVLLCLAKHPGEVLSREYLISEVWGERIQNDEGLSQAIWKLRNALGDSSRESRFIQTVRKRGYRLNVSVRDLDADQKDRSIFRLLGFTWLSLRYRTWAFMLGCCALVLFISIQTDPAQKEMNTIEEQQWVLAGKEDSVTVSIKALSDDPGVSLPEGVVDSLVFEALKSYENKQAIADSLLLEKRVDNVSIRRKLVF